MLFLNILVDHIPIFIIFCITNGINIAKLLKNIVCKYSFLVLNATKKDNIHDPKYNILPTFIILYKSNVKSITLVNIINDNKYLT